MGMRCGGKRRSPVIKVVWLYSKPLVVRKFGRRERKKEKKITCVMYDEVGCKRFVQILF